MTNLADAIALVAIYNIHRAVRPVSLAAVAASFVAAPQTLINIYSIHMA